MIELIGSRKELFNEYYKIRCGKVDIYWMGYESAPDYDMIKECYMSRLQESRFSMIGDKKIYLINDIDDNTIIGHVQLSLNEDGLEIGISIKEEYHGKGMGKESIRQTILIAKQYSSNIYARIRDDNKASINMFSCTGFIATNEYVEKLYPKAGVVKFRKYIYHNVV